MSFWKRIGELRERISRIKSLGPVLLFIVCFAVLTILGAIKFFPAAPLKVGEVSQKDIEATSTIEVVNEAATKEARRKAANSVPVVYAMDPLIITQCETKLALTIDLIRRMLYHQRLREMEKFRELRSQLPLNISQNDLETCLSLNPLYLRSVEAMVKDILWKVMSGGVREDTLPASREQARMLAREVNAPPEVKEAIANISGETIVPNLLYDLEATLKRQQALMASVKSVTTVVQRGQTIIHKGDIVAPQHLEILRALGLHHPVFNLLGFAGSAIFALFFIFTTLLYLTQKLPHLLKGDRLLLLALIVLAADVICRVSTNINSFLAPVASASILVAILLDSQLAILVTILLSAQIGIFTGDLPTTIVPLLTGTIAALVTSRVNRWSELIGGGFIVIVTNVFSVLIFCLLTNMDLLSMLQSLLYGASNGFLSVVIAVGSFPFLESAFNITTHIKLLEISNPNEPLLKKLLVEAPGTYHHSVVVGNLAESAAQSVGADPLLARVGAYYHDVGKIKRPYFFVENQLGKENPHDRLSPNLSTLIIVSHVKDGIDMARAQKIPQPIVDIIAQHHGNSIVQYFFHQALQNAKDSVSSDDFRYSAGKPTSREAAIVMLADCVEAAARTLAKPTPNKLEVLVRQIVKDALDDAQLDECDLSFRNLNDLTSAFVRTLSGMYHNRIEYPSPEKISQLMGVSPRKESDAVPV